MSTLVKRSVVIAGHSTSISLESEFWDALKKIAAADQISISALIRKIDNDLPPLERRNLSSSLRVYVLSRIQAL